jgi:hypothetical protein
MPANRPAALMLRALVILLLAVVVAGCSRGDQLRVMERSAAIKPIPLRAVVTDLDDQRERSYQDEKGLLNIPIFVLWINYYYDRHDEIYRNSTDPFPMLFAKRLAQRMEEAKVFESVAYHPPDALPPAGEYDVLIKGDLKRLQRRGWKTYYGLSLIGSVIARYLPLPSMSRWWDIEAELYMVDAYQGNPIGERQKIALQTDSEWISSYSSIGSVEGLQSGLMPALDQYVAAVWANSPPATDPSWVAIRTEGQRHLAKLRDEEEAARRGAPPEFRFLSPVEGDVFRTANVDLRWSITAPGGLKSALLSVNNRLVDLGISPLEMASPDTAPRNIAARQLTVPLQLGPNRLEALVTDHRGNNPPVFAMTITRLPAELRPANRYALLIATGREELRAGAADLQAALADPLVGQFPAERITAISQERLSSNGMRDLIGQFKNGPQNGDLTLIYLAGPGQWGSTPTIGDGQMTLAALIAELDNALATDDVVLLLDIDWSGDNTDGDDLGEIVPGMPARWVILTAQSRGGAAPVVDGRTAFSRCVVDVLRGTHAPDRRLTLEFFVDSVLAKMDEVAPQLRAKAYGQTFNRSFTLAERE